ncbi:MAG: ferritin family protein [Chloroflexota bacterium]
MDAKTSWETFFKMMIMEEHGAQKKYEMAMNLAADNPQLKKVFERFMQEEGVHAQLLEAELMKLEKKGV